MEKETNNNLIDHTKGNLKAVVVGASGASGREVVDYLIESKQWSTISIITRRKIERWSTLPLSDTQIKFILVDNLDILNETKENMLKINPDLNFEGYNTVFNCLGSRTKYGDDEFKKVDYTYVIYSATLCQKFNIPHFSHITSTSVDPKSSFLYLRVKGQTEEKLKTMNIPYLSLFRPGMILNRDNDKRSIEKIAGCLIKYLCCCVSSIECKHLGQGVAFEAERVGLGISKNREYTYSNKEIQELYQNSLKQKLI